MPRARTKTNKTSQFKTETEQMKMQVKIKDLKPHMENVQVVARVASKSKVVEFKMKKHATAIVEDSTGQIRLNLWRDQVDQVEEGDLIMIPNAFVHIRMGEKQLSTWSSIQKANLNDFV
jgi:ssDNA-binding replication factor A large subunit